jgi:hypothetical protein
MGGTSAPYNAFPYGGGHIPPSSPSLGGAHQHSVRPNVNYSSFGAGSQGLPTYSMPVGSTLFSLFDAFGNNAFSSASISVGGNPGYGQQHPVQGTIPAQGENLGIPSSQGPWNPWQGSVPCQGCRPGETPSIANGTPGKAQHLCPSDRQGETLPKILGMRRKPNPLCPIMGVS